MQMRIAARAGGASARAGIVGPAHQASSSSVAAAFRVAPPPSTTTTTNPTKRRGPSSSSSSARLHRARAAGGDGPPSAPGASGDAADDAAAAAAAADELKSRFFSDREAVPRPADGGASGAGASSNAGGDGAPSGSSGPAKRRGGVRGVKVVAAARRPGQQLPNQPPTQTPQTPQQQQQEQQQLLDSAANPFVLGRQARQAFDGLWSQLTALASPTRAGAGSASSSQFYLVDDFALATLGSAPGSAASSFEEDDGDERAAETTVLVVGATGRVGRVLVRKLLLRGYRVRALVRRRPGVRDDIEGSVPAAVQLVEGDVGDERAVRAAVRGVDKVVYCAGARTLVASDLSRVEEGGVKLLARALQDEALRRAAARAAAGLEGEEDEEEEGDGSGNGGKATTTMDKKRTKPRRFNSPVSKRVLADFGERYHQLRWDVRFVGLPPSVVAEEEAARVAAAAQPGGNWSAAAAASRSPYTRSNVARAAIGESGDTMVFEGTLNARGAVAEVGAELNPVLPRGEHRTAGAEGLACRVRGDGRIYALVLQTSSGARYAARFPTRQGAWVTVRLPFAQFRGEEEGMPPLLPSDIAAVSLRFEAPRRGGSGGAGAFGAAGSSEQQQQQQQAEPQLMGGKKESATAAAAAARPSLLQARLSAEEQAAQRAAELVARQKALVASATSPTAQKFRVEVDWIKALPGGLEPDFVLVSCAGSPRAGVDPADLARAVAAKRRGEERLRASGLGYSVVRPGPLVDEPGGYRGLVIDQADRPDRQPVSAADVADVCLRALREPAARNKTFDLSYEYRAEEGASLYELVASVPGKGGDYLAPALSVLQKNT